MRSVIPTNPGIQVFPSHGTVDAEKGKPQGAGRGAEIQQCHCEERGDAAISRATRDSR